MPSTTIDTDTTPHLYDGRTAGCKLHILIIGCGLGGLAAAHTLASSGHTITLLESAPALGEVGAGIQVSPNVSRLLRRWGLGAQLAAAAVRPEAIVFRRARDGVVVGYTRWGAQIEKKHGAPYLHVHRADFHQMLCTLATQHPNVTLRLSSTVVSIDPDSENPSVTLAGGEVLRGDLIVGADGVKSIVRQVVVGRPDRATPTGDAAYRAIISTEFMLKDPELKSFVDVPEMTAWMGPGRHLMAYNIRAKKEFNLVMLHPDDGSVESWTAEGSAEKMLADFADFEPRVRKLLSQVGSTLKWRLMDRSPLDTWVHPSGRVVLLGDSCHPMLPYRAQGAAMALEDASVLGAVLSHLPPSPSHHKSNSNPYIHPFLNAYQSLRHARATATQASSRLNQHVFHLDYGKEQVGRDEDMRDAMREEVRRVFRVEGEGGREVLAHLEGDVEGGWEGLLAVGKPTMGEKGEVNGNGHVNGEERNGGEESGSEGNEGNANQWADERKNVEQFSYDADEAAERWWAQEGEVLVRRVDEELRAGLAGAGTTT
ncbi:FAD/NAD(P)-binding domain-containing protein [Rickenella mellea]|uniref:FAD/NAD(P)-binding domain-containing protein n=1 Tax=Rickenella mellea TaxID=50990 RepID=A0A4Y7Q7C1_9AGAM|nr:FAD/NAD(P)-binding domain-containing protein [Rickenella mellea]